MASPFLDDLLKDIQKNYGDDPNVYPNDLTVDLNPMLVRARWPGINDHMWSLLLPVLRLASAMLSTHASFLFLYSVINAKRAYDWPLSTKYHANIAMIGRLDPYDHLDQSLSDVRNEYEACLRLFAKYVEWKVTLSSDPGWQNAGHYGITNSIPERATYFHNYRRRGHDGCGCNVYLNSSRLEMLEELRKKPTDFRTISATLRVQFMLAVTVCHELVHVVNRAAHGDPYEPFWEDHNLAELGRSWEQEMFGGTPWQYPHNYDYLYLVKWPMIDERARAEVLMAERAASKGTSTFYSLFMPYITRSSSQACWDTYTPTLDDSLLKIPKISGQRIPAKGSLNPNWRASQSSEGRWPVDARGYVSRPMTRAAVVQNPVRHRYPSRSESSNTTGSSGS